MRKLRFSGHSWKKGLGGMRLGLEHTHLLAAFHVICERPVGTCCAGTPPFLPGSSSLCWIHLCAAFTPDWEDSGP